MLYRSPCGPPGPGEQSPRTSSASASDLIALQFRQALEPLGEQQVYYHHIMISYIIQSYTISIV